jgi:PhzF family phenazine biosynthesis protein
MQHIAAEMNLSETAFVIKHTDGYGLRWFTPRIEVDICGHATLASAHILWENGDHVAEEDIRFHTKSGVLTVARQGDWVEMDFPAELAMAADPPSGLVESLGISPKYVGKNRFDYLLEVDSEETVRRIKPDFGRLATVPTRGVIVTSVADEGRFDFVSRFFAPAVGVNEDPVTGSAHCCLGPYWQARLGKDEFLARQVSERGGVLVVRTEGDRVFIGGHAVTVARGILVA